MATKKKAAALVRWQILKQAIVSSNASEAERRRLESISVRRFSSFELLDIEDLSNKDEDVVWKLYSLSGTTKDDQVSARVRHLPRRVTLDALTGFNNTGNVCVWPSEEVMAYHCLKQRLQFKGKSVLELGGGMTCLAGLMLSLTGLPALVCLTDGNKTSVDNVKEMVKANTTNFNKVAVTAEVLVWDETFLDSDFCQFDFVLCADCFFFTDLHSCLARVLGKVLAPGGTALLYSPHRNGTLLSFVELIEKQGDMEVQVEDIYDQQIWRRHLHLSSDQNSPGYKPDLHYPALVTLTRK